MKTIVVTVAMTILTFSVSSFSDILKTERPQKNTATVLTKAGFKCLFKTRSGAKIEIAGFSENTEEIPEKYTNLIWPGQIVTIKNGQNLIFDIEKMSVGRLGFAGRNVSIHAIGNDQILEIDFVTGATGPTNGTVKILKHSDEILAQGPAKCTLF